MFKKIFSRLAGLWLAGEVVNHVGIYGSKAAEGLSAFQRRSCSIGDWKVIYIAHVIIIIKSEVSTLPILIIFFGGCVPEMFVTSYSVTYCIYVPGKPGICLSLLCSLWWVQIVGYVLACRSYSFVCIVNHLIIIIVQTYLKSLNL